MRQGIGIAAAVLFAGLLTVPRSAPGGGRDVYDPSNYGYTGPRGCILPTTPPHLTGIALPAATRDAAEQVTRRLGFAGYWEDDVLVCPIIDGVMLWVVGLPDVPAGSLLPLAHRSYEPQDRSLPLGQWPYGRHVKSVSPPNGAWGRLGVIAIVPDADSVAHVWPPPSSEGERVPLLSFRRTNRYDEFSARSLVAPAGGWSGTVTVLEPDSDDGPAARWLAAGGPRWLGFEIGVTDLGRTAGLLATNGLESRPLDNETIWVDPEQTGGVLLLFRQPGLARPREPMHDPR